MVVREWHQHIINLKVIRWVNFISRDSFIYILLQSIDKPKLKLKLKKSVSVLSSQFFSKNDSYDCEEHTFLLTWGKLLRWFSHLLQERMPVIYGANGKRRRRNWKNKRTKQKGTKSCVFHSAIFRHSVTRHSASFCLRLGSISLAAVRKTGPRSSPCLLGDDRGSSGSRA